MKHIGNGPNLLHYTVQCQYLGISLLWPSELVSQAAGRMFQLASPAIIINAQYNINEHLTGRSGAAYTQTHGPLPSASVVASTIRRVYT